MSLTSILIVLRVNHYHLCLWYTCIDDGWVLIRSIISRSVDPVHGIMVVKMIRKLGKVGKGLIAPIALELF